MDRKGMVRCVAGLVHCLAGPDINIVRVRPPFGDRQRGIVEHGGIGPIRSPGFRLEVWSQNVM